MALRPLFPVFLDLADRPVTLVGGGRVAAAKLGGLERAGARVTVVAPEVAAEMALPGVVVHRRPFRPEDLDGAWLAVAAATPEANRQVMEAAQPRRVFVNAADDPAAATAYLGALLRRGGVTIAVSTEGKAPALAALVRDALAELLPDREEVEHWVETARALREGWKAAGVPMAQRAPLLLESLNRLYPKPPPRS